jgi:manganese transport protein
MVSGQALEYLSQPGNLFWKIIIVASCLFFVGLLVMITIYPFMGKKKTTETLQVHHEVSTIPHLSPPVYNKIAVALEFGQGDEKLLSYAIGQGSKNSSFVLIHIVESASAKILGQETDDLETRKDQEQLELYVKQLNEMGYHAEGILGFRSRAKEIVRIVNETKCDMLVAGAHGHTGIKDWLYGQTIDNVRHELKVPVLVVQL